MNGEKKVVQSLKTLLFEKRIQRLPGFLGDLNGIVKVADNEIVNVRLLSGEVIQAYNARVPNLTDMPVSVGYSDNNKNLLQILEERPVFRKPAYPQIPDHGKNHTWDGVDVVWVRGEQILPGLVVPNGGMTVKFYGYVYYLAGWHVLNTQSVDFTASIPTTGARYVLAEVDIYGTISLRNGSLIVSRGLLIYENIPAPATDKKSLFAVAVYAGQTQIVKSNTISDIVDLRFGGVGSGGIATTVDWDDILNKPTEYPPDLTYTDPVYVRKFLKSAPPTVNDDGTLGYLKMDEWLDQAGGVVYKLLDPATGAAVWVEEGAGGGGGSGDFHVRLDGILAAQSNVYYFVITKNTTINKWYIACDDPGTAGTTTYDVHRNGTTIFTTQSNRPMLAWNDVDGWAVSGVPDVVDFVEGDILTIDIDTVATDAEGLTGAGQNGSGSFGFNLIVEDESASLSVDHVGKIVVPDGLLQDNGGGEIFLAGGMSQYGIANGTTDISTASTSFVDMTDMSVTLTTKASILEILFVTSGGNSTNATQNHYQLVIDGTPVVMGRFRTATATGGGSLSLGWITTVTAASHTFKVQWKVSAGIGYCRSATGDEGRTLIVKEYAKVI